ncbi:MULTISPECIES: hypothetical protein [unclassified Ruegeria]|uniref:hypothetical protein n=1 Tax=unclassified Ruegeria TaxID=2625375 RepID=UPI0014877AA1|nr:MULTISPECIES: hypothetical protein [unclassified Ruegeria]
MSKQTEKGVKCADAQAEYDAYNLAIAIRQNPSPLLTVRCLAKRWRCSRSSVERFRKLHGLTPVSVPGEHPCFDLLDVLRLEEVDDPILLWAFAGNEGRKALLAPLLSIEDLRLLDRRYARCHLETFRRMARDGRRHGFKLGRRWLFRPTIEEVERLEFLNSSKRGEK